MRFLSSIFDFLTGADIERRFSSINENLQQVKDTASKEHRLAHNLAVALHKKHYPHVVRWKPAESVSGLILQIDNMTAGLSRPAQGEK